MSYKKTILTGTLLLTVSGLLSRILGFYNRIFLADLIGARELGIYSLIFPVYALCFTLVCHGFETGISNMTSRFFSCNQRTNIRRLLRYTCVISLFLSLCLSFTLYQIAGYLSKYLLNEPSCAQALRIASLALPFVAVKSCVHGYYIGMGKSSVSAASQLIEQCARVGGIYLLSITIYSSTANAGLAVWGMVCGEVLSCAYTLLAYLYTSCIRRFFSGLCLKIKNSCNGNHSRIFARHKGKPLSGYPENIQPVRSILKEFFSFSIPLTINHFSLTIVSSLEAILIPFVLARFYGSQNLALEAYGTLTGMAFPFLFFPATITNSLSVMLLPAISASYKQKKMVQIRYTISRSMHYCIVIGIFSAFAFLFYGNLLGETIFHSVQAGQYIYTFAALCPFMYASQTIMSILNGFGFTKKTMYHSLLCVGVRIACILLMIPTMGITGYLYGMILSSILQLLLDLFSLMQITLFSFSMEKTLLLPAALAFGGGWLSQYLYNYICKSSTLKPLFALGICGVSYALTFTVLQLLIQYYTEDHAAI